MGYLSRKRLYVCLCLVTIAPAKGQIPGHAIPAGFTDTLVARVPSPTTLAFLPDGRMLVASQDGTLRIIRDSATNPEIAFTISPDTICSNSERGLLGVAVDPQFNTNRFVYLYYTRREPGQPCATRRQDGPLNRVSRFVMNAQDRIDPASETVLIRHILSFNGNHNAGDIQFGPDGYLYIGTGDGGCDYRNENQCAGANTVARETNHLFGKILRIDRDGNVPADNPWTGPDSARCNNGPAPAGMRCRETWAFGLRNPFRFAFDPNSPTRMFINDVGQNTWEEIDEGVAGADYGWNIREGRCLTGSITNCPSPPANLRDPIYAYQRDVTVPGTQSSGCASISGGAFIPNGLWPARFDGSYLFADFACGSIFFRNASGTVSDFLRGGGSPVHVAFGPYRNNRALYYTTYARGGEVRQVTAFVAMNAASFDRARVAPGSLVTLFGAGLQNIASVVVRDSAGGQQQIQPFFTSETQANFLLPDGLATGDATLTVTTPFFTGLSTPVALDTVAPGIFTANASGSGPPAAQIWRSGSVEPVFTCNTVLGGCIPEPFDVRGGAVLILYATGMRGASAMGQVRARIAGLDLPVAYAGPQGEFPGLDQINVPLPDQLAGRGTVDVEIVVDGRTSNRVTVAVQ